jgi:hypothetical protein
VIPETLDVIDTAGGKIVDNRHKVPLPEKIFRQMGTDKTSTASDQKFHGCPRQSI